MYSSKHGCCLKQRAAKQTLTNKVFGLPALQLCFRFGFCFFIKPVVRNGEKMRLSKCLARGSPGGSKCCFRFLGWILAEICLKCIVLVTNFQKSPSAGGSPPPVPLNLPYCLLVTWSKVIWPNCGFSSWLWRNRTSKKSVMMSFLWRHRHYVSQMTSPK